MAYFLILKVSECCSQICSFSGGQSSNDNNDDNNNNHDESHEFAQLFSSLLYGFGNCDCTKMFRMQLPQAGSKGN